MLIKRGIYINDINIKLKWLTEMHYFCITTFYKGGTVLLYVKNAMWRCNIYKTQSNNNVDQKGDLYE